MLQCLLYFYILQNLRFFAVDILWQQSQPYSHVLSQKISPVHLNCTAHSLQEQIPFKIDKFIALILDLPS